MRSCVEVAVPAVARRDEELAVPNLPFGRAVDFMAGEEEACDVVSVFAGGLGIAPFTMIHSIAQNL